MRNRASTAVRLISALALVIAGLAIVPSAQADTTPPPGIPPTVSADPLPTVQVDGVVWAQVVVGRTVYVAGSFATARPAGAAPGVGAVTRSNILAYDLRTGELDADFAPVLNQQALSITASPDGSRVYVGGLFTLVNGVARSRIAAFDTATGDLVTGFAPRPTYAVRAIEATNSTVYFGGEFTSVGTVLRPYVAAASAATGALLPWDPAPDDAVTALTLNHSGSKLIVGGRFTTLGGRTGIRGLAAVDPESGTAVEWEGGYNGKNIRNSGVDGTITSLSADADGVYGTGYTYGRAAGNFEGTFMAENESGRLIWMADCHGDTYSTYAADDVVYNAGHAHFCDTIVDGFKQNEPQPWPYYRGTALTKQVAGTVTFDYYNYFDWSGTPSPRMVHWFPTLAAGTVTGQAQAGWSIVGDGTYVAMGGEFPSVNGRAQQGLVRFVLNNPAPSVAPTGGTNLTPSLSSYKAGQVRVGWLAAHDRDNEALTYRLYRNFNSLADTPIYQVAVNSRFDRRQPMSFTDRSVAPGSRPSYRVFAFDAEGNYTSGNAAAVTVSDGTSPTPYQRAVLDDSPSAYYRMDDGSGASGLVDTASADTAVANAGVSLGAAGAIASQPSTAATFDGSDAGFAAGQIHRAAPNTFSIEAWVRTTTNQGGSLVGFADRYFEEEGRPGGTIDRHLYMDNSGRIHFGLITGSRISINSPAAYNDGGWHHVAATLGSGTMRLYVDGEQVASRTGSNAARIYAGVWRIGGDELDSRWPSRPSANYFSGSIDEVAAYPVALSAAQVAGHYAAASGTGNQLPTADFTAAVNGLQVSFDATISDDPDGTIAEYAWLFGDGATASGLTASHTYPSAGPYTVTLTVTDDAGATDVTTRVIDVGVVTPNQRPTASFTHAVNGLQASFDASGSSDSDGSIASYEWSFGDGSTGTAVTATHTYAAANTYSVTLTVTDDDGATGTMTQSVTVSAPVTPPVTPPVAPPVTPPVTPTTPAVGDADGDGVPDAQDSCPTLSGPAANAGCPAAQPSAVALVKAKSKASKLYVNVNPNKGKGYWRFQVQRKNADGTWKALKTYRTKGAKETRTINLKKGTYRVVVRPKYGHLGATSAEVYLRR